MPITFTLPDYEEVEKKLEELEDRLDNQNEINKNLLERMNIYNKDIQNQIDGIRKRFSQDEDCDEDTEEDEPTSDELIEKLDEFMTAMQSLHTILKDVK